MFSMLLLILALLATGLTQEFLNNVPIVFSLNGNVNYVPSSGGIAIPGYNFTVGFDRYSWLGIQFNTLTSTNNYDTLILQRSATQSNGVYTCSISDYYVSSGRPSTLMSDSTTNMDQILTTTSNTSLFLISLPRTLGNTNGQDWQGGEFVQICFFTSDIAFSTSTWSKQYQVCYGYEINSYVSTHRGPYVATMNFEGVTSSIYGGVYGPYLKMQLFWYRPSATIPNTSNIIIQIGNQIDQYVGNDYFVCGVGDFYGSSPYALSKDLIYSGYQNGACTFKTTSKSTMMTYSRDVYTFDDFDVNITQSLNLCVIGSSNNCANLNLPLNLPAMTVSSALTISQDFLNLRNFLLLFATLFFVLI